MTTVLNKILSAQYGIAKYMHIIVKQISRTFPFS